MRNVLILFVATLCLLFQSCHRPVAYFQRTPHTPAARLSVKQPTVTLEAVAVDSVSRQAASIPTASMPTSPAIASLNGQPTDGQLTNSRVERRLERMRSLLSTPTESSDKQPEPKPKKKLKLGNQIRQSLGMRLRPELNWWQRISWKLKASVIVILVAVLFAVLHVTILAIIFGIVGAFLLISGLRRSFKVRRPWF